MNQWVLPVPRSSQAWQHFERKIRYHFLVYHHLFRPRLLPQRSGPYFDTAVDVVDNYHSVVPSAVAEVVRKRNDWFDSCHRHPTVVGPRGQFVRTGTVPDRIAAGVVAAMPPSADSVVADTWVAAADTWVGVACHR